MAKPEKIHFVRHHGPSNMDEVRIVESQFVSACQRLMCEENHEEITRAMVDVKDWMQWIHHRRVILKEELRRQILDPPWLVKYRLQRDGTLPADAQAVGEAEDSGAWDYVRRFFCEPRGDSKG